MKEIKTDFRVAASVTRYISGVPIDLRDVGIRVKRGPQSKNNIILGDSPGFDDTSGAEVDTANGLGIVQGVSKARSVKILTTLSAGDFDNKMIGVRQIAHTLTQIVQNFNDHSKSNNQQFANAIDVLLVLPQSMVCKTMNCTIINSNKTIDVNVVYDQKYLINESNEYWNNSFYITYFC